MAISTIKSHGIQGQLMLDTTNGTAWETLGTIDVSTANSNTGNLRMLLIVLNWWSGRPTGIRVLRDNGTDVLASIEDSDNYNALRLAVPCNGTVVVQAKLSSDSGTKKVTYTIY